MNEIRVDFRELSDRDMEKAKVLLEFLTIARQGMVKPFDPSQVLRKLTALQRDTKVDIGDLMNCCPQSAQVFDAIDFKPYMLAACEEFSRIMGLTPKRRNEYGDRY